MLGTIPVYSYVLERRLWLSYQNQRAYEQKRKWNESSEGVCEMHFGVDDYRGICYNNVIELSITWNCTFN